jgi:hypothetical protein
MSNVVQTCPNIFQSCLKYSVRTVRGILQRVNREQKGTQGTKGNNFEDQETEIYKKHFFYVSRT